MRNKDELFSITMFEPNEEKEPSNRQPEVRRIYQLSVTPILTTFSHLLLVFNPKRFLSYYSKRALLCFLGGLYGVRSYGYCGVSIEIMFQEEMDFSS
jgi:hypothetical protein